MARNRFSLDLKMLDESKEIRRHPEADVVVLRFGAIVDVVGGSKRMKPVRGIKVIENSKSGITGVALENIRLLSDVKVANDIYLFGYPNTIGLKDHPQIDRSSPLIRKGIVAGVNAPKSTIVLDGAVYGGNSGGPVVQVERDGLSFKFSVVGLVVEFVPFAREYVGNSGYSVAVSMDRVLDLVRSEVDSAD